ncbi:MAG: PAS domain S-box protein [Deltaproteobacteria bacterium]|nr:PAS domain S-box protein [Deltaproteobacteria bacterium]
MLRRLSTLQARLMLLVMLAGLPAPVLILYTGIEQREHARVQAQEKCLRLAGELSAEVEKMITATQQLLAAVAHFPALERLDPKACEDLFQSLMEINPFFTVLAAVDPAGNVSCASRTTTEPVNIADREYFRKAKETRDFTVSDFHVGRVSGQPSINFAYPVLDERDQIRFILIAALDVTWFVKQAAEAQAPPGGGITVIDRRGTVLGRWPNPDTWVGKDASEAEIVKIVLAQSEGVTQALSLDGVSRLYGFTPLGRYMNAGYVYVGVPVDVAFESSNRLLVRNLLALGIATALVLIGARVYGHLFVIRGVRRLLGATEKIARGDLAARTGIKPEEGEIGQLAAAFDAMAESLQKRESERDNSERALRRSVQTIEAVLKASPVPVCALDSQGLVDMWNTAAERVFDWKEEGIVGRPLPLLHDQETDQGRQLWSRILTGESLEGEEITWRKEDGSKLTISISTAPLWGARGEVMGIVAILLNITERKAAEEQLRQNAVRAQLLAEISEAFARTGLNYGPLLKYVARRATDLLGAFCVIHVLSDDKAQLNPVATYHRDPSTRLHLRELLSPVRLSSDKDALGEVVNSGRGMLAPIISREFLRDLAPRLYDDFLEHFSVRSLLIAPLRAEEQVIGTLTMVRDKPGIPFNGEDQALLQYIADRAAVAIANARLFETVRRLNAELERRVAERTAQLQLANKELEAFSYSVSHDLRAPLRAIDGFSRLLLERGQDSVDAQARDYLFRVRASTQRMGRLIDDLLQLSRLTRNEMSIGPVDLSAMVREIADELSLANPERDVELTVEDGLHAQGDQRLLRVALENLLANAWKFTSGKPTARIEFGAMEQDGQVVYCVRDNGAGFDMAYVEKLFGAFQRLHSATDFPGTGIGLAIVQRVIHRHGGRVWAEGVEAQGSAFYFTLPRGAQS